jgi:hypothetical protein
MILPVAMLSYPSLFEPKAYKNGTPKYSAVLVLPAEADLKQLKTAVSMVAKERFGDRAKAILAGNNPIHGTEQSEAKGYPEGSVYINAKTVNRPQIVSRFADPKTGKPQLIEEADATEIGGPSEMYPGVWVKAYISVYSFDAEGNKGVAFGLEGLQRWEDGERLDGMRAATDIFEAEMPAEADLEDLLDESPLTEEEDPILDIL